MENQDELKRKSGTDQPCGLQPCQEGGRQPEQPDRKAPSPPRLLHSLPPPETQLRAAQTGCRVSQPARPCSAGTQHRAGATQGMPSGRRWRIRDQECGRGWARARLGLCADGLLWGQPDPTPYWETEAGVPSRALICLSIKMEAQLGTRSQTPKG